MRPVRRRNAFGTPPAGASTPGEDEWEQVPGLTHAERCFLRGVVRELLLLLERARSDPEGCSAKPEMNSR